MTLQRIFKAAENDMRTGRVEPHCGSQQDTFDDVSWAPHYVEPGYDNPKREVLFANWNNWPTRLTDILETVGYACEWEDEWTTCDYCGGAARMAPNSYDWQASILVTDGDEICRDCMDWEDECQRREDDSNRAVPSYVNPSEHGYVRLSDPREFENGFHPGQNDKPENILQALHAQGKRGILFRISGKGQFDVSFETWIREDES